MADDPCKIVNELSDDELTLLISVARSGSLAYTARWFGEMQPGIREAAVAMLIAFLVDQCDFDQEKAMRYVEVYRNGHIAAYSQGNAGLADRAKA